MNRQTTTRRPPPLPESTVGVIAALVTRDVDPGGCSCCVGAAHGSQQELFLCSVAWFPPDPAAGLAKALSCLASSMSPQVLLIVSESFRSSPEPAAQGNTEPNSSNKSSCQNRAVKVIPDYNTVHFGGMGHRPMQKSQEAKVCPAKGKSCLLRAQVAPGEQGGHLRQPPHGGTLTFPHLAHAKEVTGHQSRNTGRGSCPAPSKLAGQATAWGSQGPLAICQRRVLERTGVLNGF